MKNANDGGALQTHDLRQGLGSFSAYDKHVDNLLASTPWVTPLIIGVNVAVFVAMTVMYRTAAGFNPLQLAAWGGNSGLLDLAGQWWRLLTYQFLHANLLHIAVNMLVLWNVGRLTERLYGSVTFLVLYLVAGVLAGFLSMVWSPGTVSVGASGSIFGVLGAFLAFLLRSRNEVPSSVLRHWFPTLIFVGYNLFAGAYEPGTDNAAHVGGLIAGFCLGVIVARPLDSRRAFQLRPVLAAILLAGVTALPPLWYLGAFSYRPSPRETFATSHSWYVEGEAKNLGLWQTLATRLASGTVSNDEAGRRFARDIVPFWKVANARLQGELKRPGHDKNPFLPLVADFAKTRLNWAQAIVAAMRDNSPQNIQTILDYVQQNVRVQAAIDRLNLRSAADNLPTPLSENAIAIWAKSHVPGLLRHCVDAPEGLREPLSSSDSVTDGPAQRHLAGCLAQRMFLTGDYAALDATIKRYSRNLADLPDGSSRLEGTWAGLDDLFSYGQLPISEAMWRTSQWRRAVNDSVEPDLVEAQLFRDWAYAARGHGYASSVSPQAMQLYLARSAMAALGLKEVAASAASDPMWYALSVGVDRDLSVPIDQQLALYDRGVGKFPSYLPLYRQMLTSFMPRWGGSVEAVEWLIRDASMKDARLDAATYARLYIIYGNLEGNDFNVMAGMRSDPIVIRKGMEELRERYRNSDYILNAVARLACIDNEADAYRAIRASLAGHESTAAWQGTLSVARCDRRSS